MTQDRGRAASNCWDFWDLGKCCRTICFSLVLPYPVRAQVVPRGAKMGILILKVYVMWSLVALAAGLSLGAAIRRGDRARKDVFLSCVFASLETLQTYRG
jgi:hypothetical protein